jgi:hypothetical protein
MAKQPTRKEQMIQAISELHQVSYLVAECIYDAYKAEQHSKALEADNTTISRQIKIRTLLDDCYPKED